MLLICRRSHMNICRLRSVEAFYKSLECYRLETGKNTGQREIAVTLPKETKTGSWLSPKGGLTADMRRHVKTTLTNSIPLTGDLTIYIEYCLASNFLLNAESSNPKRIIKPVYDIRTFYLVAFSANLITSRQSKSNWQQRLWSMPDITLLMIHTRR